MKLKTIEQFEEEKGTQTAAAKALKVGLPTYRWAKTTKKNHYVLIVNKIPILIQDKTGGINLD